MHAATYMALLADAGCWLLHVLLPMELRPHATLLWPMWCAALWPRLRGSWTCHAPAALVPNAQCLMDGCYGGPAEATRVSGPRRRRSPRRSLFLQELPGRGCGKTALATHQAVPALQAPRALSWRASAEVIVSAAPPAQRRAVLLAQSRPQTNLDAVRAAKAMVAAAAEALPAVSMTAQVEAAH